MNIEIKHPPKGFFFTYYLNINTFCIYGFSFENMEINLLSVELFSKNGQKSKLYSCEKLYNSLTQMKVPESVFIPDLVKEQVIFMFKSYLSNLVNNIRFNF